MLKHIMIKQGSITKKESILRKKKHQHCIFGIRQTSKGLLTVVDKSTKNTSL